MHNTQTISDGPHWFVAYTLSRFEKKVHERLKMMSVYSFLPLHLVMRKWSDRNKRVEVPLFPNYIFVCLPKKEMYKVLTIPGVVKFISCEGQPVTIPESEIEMIRKMISYGSGICVENSNTMIEKGDKVRITEGPFNGIEGTIISKQGKQRLVVMLEKIDKTISVEYSARILEKVSQ